MLHHFPIFTSFHSRKGKKCPKNYFLGHLLQQSQLQPRQEPLFFFFFKNKMAAAIHTATIPSKI